MGPSQEMDYISSNDAPCVKHMEMYKFVKQLGRGRFGDVWLVRGLTTKKQYVLKHIDLHRAPRREQRAAYQEVKLLATLEHPNIVSYLDSFHDSNGSLYIIMGYCECGDLYNYIRDRNGFYFEEKQIICWFVQISMALKYLHDRNILHRDLKTQNIFLTRNQLIKVGDLGIARVLNGAHDMATTIVGTPYYMSPEMFNNKPYNHKSDVWALGCCVYEMATLKQAFAAQDIQSLIQKVVSGKVPVILRHYSSEFSDIVSSMLAPDPDERPSANEILLNPYVRKHILMFLEGTKYSIDARTRHCSNSSSTESGSVTWDKAHTFRSDDSKKLSENALPLIEPKKPLQCGSRQLVPDGMHCDAQSNIVVTPDINGNGDGNDNSQQHDLTKGKLVSKTYLTNGSTEVNKSFKVPEVTSHPPTNFGRSNTTKTHRGCSKENLNPYALRNCFSQPSHSILSHSESRFRMEVQKHLPKKPHTYITTAKELQTNGEMSLNFLNNLTYTIKQARNTAPVNAGSNFGGTAVSSSTTTPRSLCISVQSLPTMKGNCLLCSTHVNDSSSDTNVELLKQIMKSTQGGHTNPEARKRRRKRLQEEMKMASITKSAPASVELLPAI